MIYNEKQVRKLIREVIAEAVSQSPKTLDEQKKEDQDFNIDEIEGINVPPYLQKMLDPDIAPAEYAKLDQKVDAGGNPTHQAMALAAFALSYGEMDQNNSEQILTLARKLVAKIIKKRDQAAAKKGAPMAGGEAT